MPQAPHMQIGQKGKGKGRKKRNRPGPIQRRNPRPAPGGLEPQPPIQTTPPNFMGFPNMPPAPPNFLPNTPGFEAAQTGINDQLMAARTNFDVGQRTNQAGYNLGLARTGTDEGYAKQALDNSLNDRGVYDSGIRPQLYTRDIAVPFGRQRQDLASTYASRLADLTSQLGQSELSGNQDLMNAYLQRANDAFQAQPLGGSYGSYSPQAIPEFTPAYPPLNSGAGGGSKPKKGKKNPKGHRGHRRGK